MAINSSTARGDIFKEFRAVIVDNIATPGVKVTNAFVDDVAEFPQVVINAPSLPRERDSFGTVNYKRDGEIEIEIFATKMKSVVELVDDVENAILSNLDDLSVQNINIGSSTNASFQLSQSTIHTLVIPISFIFRR